MSAQNDVILQIVDLVKLVKGTSKFAELQTELKEHGISIGTLRDLYAAYEGGFSDGVLSRHVPSDD